MNNSHNEAMNRLALKKQSRQDEAVKVFKDFLESDDFAEFSSQCTGERADKLNLSVAHIINTTAELMSFAPTSDVYDAIKAIHVFNTPWYKTECGLTDSLTRLMLLNAPIKTNESCVAAVQEIIEHYKTGSKLTVCNSNPHIAKDTAYTMAFRLSLCQNSHWLTSNIPFGFMFVHLWAKCEEFKWKQSESMWNEASAYTDVAAECKRLAKSFAKDFEGFTNMAEYLSSSEDLRKTYLDGFPQNRITLMEVLDTI